MSVAVGLATLPGALGNDTARGNILSSFHSSAWAWGPVEMMGLLIMMALLFIVGHAIRSMFATMNRQTHSRGLCGRNARRCRRILRSGGPGERAQAYKAVVDNFRYIIVKTFSYNGDDFQLHYISNTDKYGRYLGRNVNQATHSSNIDIVKQAISTTMCILAKSATEPQAQKWRWDEARVLLKNRIDQKRKKTPMRRNNS